MGGEPTRRVASAASRLTARSHTGVAQHTRGDGCAPHGHAELEFDSVRVPSSNLLHVEGRGFAMAQARLGPGRIHHCMRAVGLAERALAQLCRRAKTRRVFGQMLAQKGPVEQAIALSRMELEQVCVCVRRVGGGG